MTFAPNAIWVVRSHDLVVDPAREWEIIYKRTRPSAFRGQRLAIPDSIAPRFDLLDVSVSHKPQLPTPLSGELLATRLSDRARIGLVDGEIVIEEPATAEFGLPLSMDPWLVGMELCVKIRLRKGPPPTEFEMLILGVESGRGLEKETT